MSFKNDSVVCDTYIFNDKSMCKESSTLLSAWSGPLESKCGVEGYIELIVNGVVVLDDRHWDLVDAFWAYFPGHLHDYASSPNKRVSFMFPDQPLEVTMERQSFKRMQVTVYGTTVSVNEEVFLKTMVNEASQVLQWFQSKCIPFGEKRLINLMQESMALLGYS